MAPSKDVVQVENPRLSVSKYYLVDDNDEPVSFSILPIQWSKDEEVNGDKALGVFLLGNIDGGVRRIHKQVMAWRFCLSNPKPEIFVLAVDKTWIELEVPKKSFEGVVRPILVTLQCLHCVIRRPHTSRRSMWQHLEKKFGVHEVKPFESDLGDNLDLVFGFIERNDLANSKFILEFLDQTPKEGFEPKDPILLLELADKDESNQNHDPTDNVCTLCDEGGDLLSCEGPCRRSFHATPEAADAADSNCESLGFTEDEVDAMPNFICKNCKYQQHQCFVCGDLGSSDKEIGTEVFPCTFTSCGLFYHSRCVSNLLHRGNKDAAEELESEISQGRPFTCPIHTCRFCKKVEDEDDPQLQFAVCRRCPKSYHRKCLPSNIAFKANKKKGVFQRAWDDILPNRILIYCLKHKIDEDLETPARVHVKFPDVEDETEKISCQKRNSNDKENNKRKRVRVPEKIRSANRSDTETESRCGSSEAETQSEGPSSSASEAPRRFIGSRWYNEARKYFAPGPFEAYQHHVNGGWITDD